MPYLIAGSLAEHWGPLRLLESHLALLVTGALLAALAVRLLLPRQWGILPIDRGKIVAADNGWELPS